MTILFYFQEKILNYICMGFVCTGWCHRVLLEGRGQFAGVSSLCPPIRDLYLELWSCLVANAFVCWAISGLKNYYFFFSDKESEKKVYLCILLRAKIYI